ncbi:MAG: hypothetical protein ABSF56_01765 [Minisyncoccia bacterium]|jgi:hypothetical protein
MQNEIINSFKEEIKKRLTTSFYGTYIIFWLIFHHEFVLSLFFADGDKIWSTTGLLKSQYLSKEFFNSQDWHSYLGWMVPIILTWLFIEYFQKYVAIYFFRLEQLYDTEKKIIQISEQRKIEVAQKSLEKASVEKLEVVEKKTQKEKQIRSIDPTIEWQKELEYISSNQSALMAIRDAVLIIYRSGGEFTGDVGLSNSIAQPYLNPDSLSRLDTMDIVSISKGIYGNKIAFTSKGKYLVRRLQEQGKV